eukprot:g10098.t1
MLRLPDAPSQPSRDEVQKAVRQVVETAIAARRHVVVEAGCGVGKTRAVLESLKAAAHVEGGLTADFVTRTWQQLGQVMAEAQSLGIRPRVRLPRGKACLSEEVKTFIEASYDAGAADRCSPPGCSDACPHWKAADDIEDLGQYPATLPAVMTPQQLGSGGVSGNMPAANSAAAPCAWRLNSRRLAEKNTNLLDLNLMTHAYFSLAFKGVGRRHSAVVVVDEIQVLENFAQACNKTDRALICLSGTIVPTQYGGGVYSFTRDTGEIVVCVAHARGNFTEGANIPLKGLAVVGLPYAADGEVEADPGRKFEDMAVCVRQAMGRVIRGPENKGKPLGVGGDPTSRGMEGAGAGGRLRCDGSGWLFDCAALDTSVLQPLALVFAWKTETMATSARDLFRTPRDGGLFGPRFGDEDDFRRQRDLFVRRPSDVYVQLNQLKAQLEQLKGPQGGPVRVQLGPALREQRQQFPDLRKRIQQVIQQFDRAWFHSPSVLALPPLVRVFRAKVALARYPLLRAGIGMGSVPLLVRILTRAVAGGSGALLGGAAAGTLPAVLFAISKSQDVLARAMNLADVTHLADVEKAIAKRCEMANMDTEQVPRSKAYSFLQLSRRAGGLQKSQSLESGQRSVVVSPTGASGEDTEKPKEALEG